MRKLIQNLSPKAEFIVVAVICFSYTVVSSLYVLLSGVKRVELNSARVFRAIAVEVFILAAVAIILGIRGWRPQRLGLKFSWRLAAAGVPLFIFYLLLYWIAATLALLVYPAARTISVFQLVNRAPFWLIVIFSIVNSFFEEISVSAYVIEVLSREGAGVAVTASTLLRFSYHLYQGPVASLSIIPLGLLFSGIYWRGRNVWPLVVAHTIANVVVFALNTAGPANS